MSWGRLQSNDLLSLEETNQPLVETIIPIGN